MRARIPLAIAASIFLQCANLGAFQKIALDERPFGKYLIRICTVTDSNVSCSKLPNPDSDDAPFTPAPPGPEKRPQTISLKLACAPGVDPCKPDYPIVSGKNFYIAASADSGLTVGPPMIRPGSAGSATLVGAPTAGLTEYLAGSPGALVIEVTGTGNPVFAPPPPVELVLSIVDKPPTKPDDSTCMGLFPGAPVASFPPRVNLSDIVTLLGTPTPFTLSAAGTDQILLYSSRFPLTRPETEFARALPGQIATLARQTRSGLGVTAAGKMFSVELTIPHASALGDAAARINALNYSDFTAQDIGSDRVRIKASAQPGCDLWTSFLSSIRRMEWQLSPEPLEQQLFYLTASDVVTAFNTLAGGSSSAAAPAPASSSSTPAASAAPTSTSAAGNATIAVTQPPGSVVDIKSNTTPCVVAGLTLSNSSACAPASGSGAGSSGSSASASATVSAPKPPGMANVPMTTPGQQIFSDLLVFSDANPGDDAQVLERKRVLALLDLPRPEMIVNAWVMQNSTADAHAMGTFSQVVRGMVDRFNLAVNRLNLKAWEFVAGRTGQNGFFNAAFYSYIADRYVADTHSAKPGTNFGDAAQQFLSTSPSVLADGADQLKADFGICESSRYCMGYNQLFHPLKPRLTDILLTLIAADNPVQETEQTILSVQNGPGEKATARDCETASIVNLDGQHIVDARDLRARCRAIWSNLSLERSYGCVTDDHRKILKSLISEDPKLTPRVYLTCFKEAAKIYLDHPELLRVAIADFLFNYKLSQQYPHEFVPYDLSQSADAVNIALSPLIDAFNHDIVAFQNFLRADMQHQVELLNANSDRRCCVKKLFSPDKPSFFNDGIVTVRTISGQPTTANTTSQSYVDASSAPTLSNLVNNVATAGTAATGTSPLSGVLGAGAQPAASLAAGVLNSYQTTYAQIGRALNLVVTPRSLATASAAELTVSLMADDSSGTPAYSGGPAGAQQPNTSHVANHDVISRVRVESVRLFELSSFSAVVERSRSKFPLLPPFVELPYIGSLAGIPIPAAKEYHASTAVISAMVVPTAADIAYGLRFAMDQVLDGDAGPCSFLRNSTGDESLNVCRFRRAISLGDLNHAPIRNFHKFMLNCLATGMQSPYSSVASLAGGGGETSACKDLTFDKVPHDAF